MNTAGFCIGDVIRHKLFGYHGVIYDVDAVFMGTGEWYETVARSRPPKDQPWYRVLVDGYGDTTTYVAERNLERCPGFREISHPLLELYFDGHDGNVYSVRSSVV